VVSNEEPPFVVTLVHGTWGRGFLPWLTARSSKPRWFETGSPFRSQLISELSLGGVAPIIEEFHWSGRNSIKARRNAAVQLSNDITKHIKLFPNATHTVIGHSHGGNIALSALSNQVPNECLLVSLATPFLTIKKVPASAKITRNMNFVSYAFIAFIAWQLTQLFAHVTQHSRWDDVSTFDRIVSIGVNLVTYYIWLAVVVGIKGGVAESEVDSLDSKHSALVVREIDDEANLALVAGNIVSKLSRLLISFMVPITTFVQWSLAAVMGGSIMVMILSIIGLNIITDFDSFVEKIITWGLFLAIGNVICIFVMLIFSVLIGVGRTVNGVELIFGGVMREINVQTVPDSQGSIEIKTLPTEPRTGFSLRHSIYENKHCAAVVTSWLRAQHQKRLPVEHNTQST
jgi:hypothetical protein